VTAWLEHTAVNRTKPLPESLPDLLDGATRIPASADSQKAFAQGFVFAMDVKNAQKLSLIFEYAECQEEWYLAAKDLWPSLVHDRDDQTGTTLVETLSSGALASTALDDLQHYRRFRSLGVTASVSLEEA
jgi:hypothetical protein